MDLCGMMLIDMHGVRYANNLLKNPATKRLSGKTFTGYAMGWNKKENSANGEFRKQVKICNSASEEATEGAMLKDKTEIMRAYGVVEHAMKEALSHAFGVTTYSFFSDVRPVDHYKFDIQEFQPYILSKSNGRINKEMMHVMHYHGVEN